MTIYLNKRSPEGRRHHRSSFISLSVPISPETSIREKEDEYFFPKKKIFPFLRCQGGENLEAFVIVKTKIGLLNR